MRTTSFRVFHPSSPPPRHPPLFIYCCWIKPLLVSYNCVTVERVNNQRLVKFVLNCCLLLEILLVQEICGERSLCQNGGLGWRLLIHSSGILKFRPSEDLICPLKSEKVFARILRPLFVFFCSLRLPKGLMCWWSWERPTYCTNDISGELWSILPLPAPLRALLWQSGDFQDAVYIMVDYSIAPVERWSLYSWMGLLAAFVEELALRQTFQK